MLKNLHVIKSRPTFVNIINKQPITTKTTYTMKKAFYIQLNGGSYESFSVRFKAMEVVLCADKYSVVADGFLMEFDAEVVLMQEDGVDVYKSL